MCGVGWGGGGSSEGSGGVILFYDFFFSFFLIFFMAPSVRRAFGGGFCLVSHFSFLRPSLPVTGGRCRVFFLLK